MKTAVRVARAVAGRFRGSVERRAAQAIIAALLERAYTARELADKLPRRQGALQHD